jgi:phage baseplate assembly protein W
MTATTMARTTIGSLARNLAAREDWGSVIAALTLPEAQARALRVQILRERVFSALSRHRPRARHASFSRRRP